MKNKIRPVLKSVQDFIPKLISRFSSIRKDVEFESPSDNSMSVLRDSKDIQKARKNVKESLYTILDTFFSNLQTNDIRSIRDGNIDINISGKNFDNLVNRFYTEIRPLCDAFITEKKMSPSICKYVTIVLSGLLIELANEENDK